MEDFQFDPISFVIGLVSGFAVSFVLYRVRNWLGSMRRGAEDRAESARKYATRTADNRYTLDFISTGVTEGTKFHTNGDTTSTRCFQFGFDILLHSLLSNRDQMRIQVCGNVGHDLA